MPETGAPTTVEAALQRSRDRQELLARTISALLTAPDPQTVIEKLCHDVRRFLDCAVFFNFLLDPERRRLRLNACGGVPPRLARKVEDLELGSSLCGTAARDACRILVEELETSSDPRSALVRSLGIRAYACHPLLGPDNRVIGTLSFGARNRACFNPEDLDLMKTVTDHVAVAMLRSESERALREGEERFRMLVEATSQAVWETDGRGRVMTDSPGWRAYTGQSREDWLSAGWLEAVHPEDRALAEGLWGEALVDVKNFNAELRLRSHDGTWRWTNLRATPIRNVDGTVGKWVGMNVDISDRKGAEAKLRESERLYRAIGESIDYGIWICDAQGRNTYASESFLKLVGMTQAQCSAFGWGNVLHPEDADATIAAWKECVQKGGPWYREHRYRGVDGQWHPILACGVAVRDEHGQVVCWAGINLDIQRLKAAEEALRESEKRYRSLHADLERLVAERTAKLQELVAELEHFSYTITHDMRAPLRAMRGYGELVMDLCTGPEQSEQKEFVRKIMVAAQRMDALITDALSYSRAVRQELPLADVDTGALVRGMLDSYPELQPSKAHVQIKGSLPIVLGNEAGLTQVFSNLLGNSVKFVKPGERPNICIWAEEQDGWTRIWVEDQGIGIPEDMLPRVFDMFSRGDPSYEGTGIGLALVRKVTQRMGGRVGVLSTVGTGSRFWLEFKPGEGRRILEMTASNTKQGNEVTVLYVEDEENDALFMLRAFKMAGMGEALRRVRDGRAAIEYLAGVGVYRERKKFPVPAVVLLDLNLPLVPGFDVLKWIRNQADYFAMPVVIFSSSKRTEDLEKASALGANDFLEKPTSGLKFSTVVEALRNKWFGQPAKADPGSGAMNDS